MATRNLTDVFILMRNNALQSKHIFSEQSCDDRASLVNHQDVELGVVSYSDTRQPPEWVEGIDEIHYIISKIKEKMKDLVGYHEKHVTRPTLDDQASEEKEIEVITNEITRMFVHCQQLVKRIRSRSQHCTGKELQLRNNMVSCLASTLQDLSTTFRQHQSRYLNRLKSREEQSQLFLDMPLEPNEEDLFVQGEPLVSITEYDQAFLQRQEQLVEENTQFIEQREREINQIVQSISDLNQIFKDLGHLVSDQGTIIDRIDYNLEHVQTQVHQGLRQLQKAESYQRKNHKMMCILVLAASTMLLLILLVIFKL